MNLHDFALLVLGAAFPSAAITLLLARHRRHGAGGGALMPPMREPKAGASLQVRDEPEAKNLAASELARRQLLATLAANEAEFANSKPVSTPGTRNPAGGRPRRPIEPPARQR